MGKTEGQDPGLVVVELRAENFKRLEAVQIRPGPDPLVVVGGQNGAGKSSVLDALMAALGGKWRCPSEPVRRGAAKSILEVDLGEVTVRRTMTTGGGGELTVKGKDGTALATPQAVLDAMLGPISFDPLEFVRAVKDQRVLLLGALLGVDLEEMGRAYQAMYDARRDLTRDLKAKRLVAKQEQGAIPEGTPDEAVDTAALLADLDEMAAARQANAKRREALARLENQMEAARAQVDAAEAAVRDAQEALANRMGEFNDLCEQHNQATGVAIPADPDERPVREMVARADAVNRAVEAKRRVASILAGCDGLEAQVAKVEADMAALRDKRTAAIQAADLPVMDLGHRLDVEDGEVTLGGLPFDQASSAEQLRTSVALAIAANPRLRVMLVRDGSLLDGNSLDMIADMARESGHQVWIERVGEGPEATVVIADGHVVRGGDVNAGQEEA